MRIVAILSCFLFLLFLVPAYAQSTSASPATVERIMVNQDVRPTIVPLSVVAPDSLSAISVVEKTAESVFVREKQAYLDSQSRLLSASAAEQPGLRIHVAEQRYRYLLSTLNRVMVVYHRLDFMLNKMDGSILRLRSLYRQKGNVGISDFDARIQQLESRLDALHADSASVRADLENVTDNVNTVSALRTARDSVSELLHDFRPFLKEYQGLAQDVVQLP